MQSLRRGGFFSLGVFVLVVMSMIVREIAAEFLAVGGHVEVSFQGFDIGAGKLVERERELARGFRAAGRFERHLGFARLSRGVHADGGSLDRRLEILAQQIEAGELGFLVNHKFAVDAVILGQFHDMPAVRTFMGVGMLLVPRRRLVGVGVGNGVPFLIATNEGTDKQRRGGQPTILSHIKILGGGITEHHEIQPAPAVDRAGVRLV